MKCASTRGCALEGRSDKCYKIIRLECAPAAHRHRTCTPVHKGWPDLAATSGGVAHEAHAVEVRRRVRLEPYVGLTGSLVRRRSLPDYVAKPAT